MAEHEFDINELDIIEPIEENDLSESPYEKDCRMPRDISGYPPIIGFPQQNFPNPNFPNPNMNNPNINNPSIQAPPKITPNKNDPQVKSLNSNSGGNLKSVSPNSISICLYKNTYIWEESGRSYWMFITYLDNKTASGFRWFGNRWGYFGIDLKKIDSFVCYRDVEDSATQSSVNSQYDTFSIERKEYLQSIVRDVYRRNLKLNSIDSSKSSYCVEISIPETIDDFNRTLILSYADIISEKYLNKLRSSIIDDYNDYIIQLIHDFSCDLEIKLYNLQIPQNQLRNIKCCINNILI